MAGRGPAPKPDEQRRRRNKPSVDGRQLVRDGLTRGPSLEEITGVPGWSDQTVAWYERWRTSPQAQAFEDTDWQRLGMLAPLVETYWNGGPRTPRHLLMGEIRLNEERLGATVVDRQRARLTIKPLEDGDAPEGGATVTRIDDIRARMAAQEDDDE